MEELTPIRNIPANFGRGEDFSPPSTADFLAHLEEEAREVSDNPYASYEADLAFWMLYASDDDIKTFKRLTLEIEAAEEAYEKADPEHSHSAFEIVDELRAKQDRLVYSTGKHICAQCFYCDLVDKSPFPHHFTCSQKGEKNQILIRPMTEACQHFSHDVPPEVEARIQKVEQMNRNNPEFLAFKVYSIRVQKLRNLVKMINSDISAAFYLYKMKQDYYSNLLDEIPEALEKTEFKTKENFIKAFEEWEKDCIIKTEGNRVTLSVSDEKFFRKSPNRPAGAPVEYHQL